MIFVVQADEGPYPRSLDDSFARASEKTGVDRLADFAWLQASDEEVATKFGILNALYFGAGRRPEMPSTLTPVNNWRVIFGHLDGIEYPLLPDRYFVYPDAREPYRAIDITERMAAIPR